MERRDPRIDAYIAKSVDFARPTQCGRITKISDLPPIEWLAEGNSRNWKCR